MKEQITTKEKIEKKPESEPQKEESKITFSWIVLGIGAVLLMWVISSWFFR